MIQFYAPDILTTGSLPESDSRHCSKVLRMKAGHSIEVIDGKGHRFTCVIDDPHPKRTLVHVTDTAAVPLSWQQEITVAVAPSKHMDRMEWLVEKLTEIGVNRIIPLLCARSERKEINTERLEKIAVSAMKQSLKAVLPIIEPMTPFRHAIASISSVQKFIAYCDRSIPRKLLAGEYLPEESAAILIGPEGDFSPEEITLALDNAYRPVSLGDNRLRTETAALSACDTFHILDMAAQTVRLTSQTE
ncbi:MAG: 16S rRNA (uracil(1498)-N(3))-methyltransferase [Paramuribaculum sp.]|nr:16S rRNA (uracil(1498)-N(3))-methyltransferase [Paramuribaculum sp.]